ncbi:hypothetical protein H4R33_003602 [Dimargaris cristalligena]|nr:hypothetical protein H4R33_003602 [Dimargaris cristalligena]
MLPTLPRFAATVPHKHVPLIRFLGPRRLLPQTHSSAPGSASPAAPQSTKPPTSPAHSGALEYSELPSRYRSAGPTAEEMEAIESGGATAIY